MAKNTLISNGTVVTLDETGRVIEDGAVLIEDNVIRKVGPRSEISAPDAETVDAGGGIIMPGLINAHGHYYSTFACGIGLKDEPPSNFKEILDRLWWRLDKALTLEDVYYSAVAPMCRGLRAGTTTVFDHHASPSAVSGSLEQIAKASREIGMRTCVCYEVSDRDGERVTREGLAENEAGLEAYWGKGDDMLSAMVGLHASMTLSDQTLAAAVELGRKYKAGWHIHVSESRFDPEDSRARCGKRVVHRLADLGIKGDRTIFAHCIHLDESELEELVDSGTNVVHNPQSNMNNAVGAADVLRMLSMGIPVGLGTDAMTFNMFDELHVAHLLQKHHTGDPRAGFGEACEMLFNNNRRIASRFFSRPVGALQEDYLADVIVIDYQPVTPLNADNFYGHAMFGLYTAPVKMTMVDGRVRMRDGVVLGIDERHAAAESRRLAAKVWERF